MGPIEKHQHIVHLLIRRPSKHTDQFLVYPREGWIAPGGKPYLTLPSKRTVTDPLAPYIRGSSIDAFVDLILHEELGLSKDAYVLERELPALNVSMMSPVHQQPTDYTVYPLDIWVLPEQLESLSTRCLGEWLNLDQALTNASLSPSASAVFGYLRENPLKQYSVQPSMDGLALKWLGQNRGGLRYLPRQTLDNILDIGNHAFNLRVADPYLRYQMQGVGFTWSFFTHKDRQDIHVHGAPIVEIYGVLEGEMEIWSKPYYDRGTSAWSHTVLQAGDWVEVDSLQCHIVRWRTLGKGVVFKAGPGPLTGVGRLGEKGKTPCTDCPCMKPSEVIALAGDWAKG